MADTPRIESITPAAVIPGGEVAIRGSGFAHRNGARPTVLFGSTEGNLLLSSDNYLVARVPEGATGGAVKVSTGGGESKAHTISLGVQIADNLNPVANPALDAEGNIYVTFSGQRGQKVPVPLYKITPNYLVKPYVTELVNPTGLAVDKSGNLFVSCRNDGTIHRITPDGRAQHWVGDMGIATGIAFDHNGDLYVGDRSGTIFKINAERQILVFATLEPSIAAYHLAFSSAGDLYVAAPTTSSYDRLYKITPGGDVSAFYRGLGRPQGLAFDARGNLYVAASLAGRRGVVRITADGKADLVVSGPGVVGLALLPSRRAILATNSAIFNLDWDIEGAPLPV